jgi:hypothetical protein
MERERFFKTFNSGMDATVVLLPGADTGRTVEAEVGDTIRTVWPKGSAFAAGPAYPNSIQMGSGMAGLTIREFTECHWKPYRYEVPSVASRIFRKEVRSNWQPDEERCN